MPKNRLKVPCILPHMRTPGEKLGGQTDEPLLKEANNLITHVIWGAEWSHIGNPSKILKAISELAICFPHRSKVEHWAALQILDAHWKKKPARSWSRVCIYSYIFLKVFNTASRTPAETILPNYAMTDFSNRLRLQKLFIRSTVVSSFITLALHSTANRDFLSEWFLYSRNHICVAWFIGTQSVGNVH